MSDPGFVNLARDILLKLCEHERASVSASERNGLGLYEDFLGARAVRIADGFFKALRERDEDMRRTLALTDHELEVAKVNKLQAIKMVRERTGLPLKDAKAIVDKHVPPRGP